MPLRDGDLSLTTSQTLVDTAREERFSPFNLSTAAAVLQNVDILYSLFDGNHGFHGVLTRGDLARCARVSRAFSDAALRVLWRNPLTLRPLWHVLAPPRLAFPEESATTADYYKELEAAGLHENPTIWERLIGYARRIRQVEMDTTSMWGREEIEIFQRLLQQIGRGRSLFPCLQSLEIISAPCALPTLGVLFTSNLRSLTIAVSDDVDESDIEDSALTWAIISSTKLLQHTTSQLRCLRLKKGITFSDESDLSEDDTVPGRVLLRNISGLLHLQTLTLTLPCSLPAYEVSSIAALPALTSLHLDNVYGTPEDYSFIAHQRSMSPKLRECELEGNSVGILAVLTGIYAPQLHSLQLDLEMDDLDPTQDVSSCTTAIARAVNPDNFARFIVVLRDDRDEPQEAGTQLARFLQPLMSLHELSYFRLASDDVDFIATDAGLACLFAECRWIKLEELDFSGISWSDDTTAPSSYILYRLRMACPRLQKLSLPYLFPRLEVPTLLIGETLDFLEKPHPLRLLRIANTYWLETEENIADDVVMSLARYVHVLFPAFDLSGGQWSFSASAAWRSVFLAIESM